MSSAAILQFCVGIVMIVPLIFFEQFFDTAGNAQALGSGLDMSQVEEDLLI